MSRRRASAPRATATFDDVGGPAAQPDPSAPAPGLPAAFWLGGGCGSGKTTAARWAALRLDLRFYPVDGHNYAHADRAASGDFPLTLAVSRQGGAAMWRQEAASLAESFAAVSAERVQMACADLHALGAGPTVIVEGPQLFPDLVAGLMRSPRHGLWLLPTAEFGYRGVLERGGGRPGAPAHPASRERHARQAVAGLVGRHGPGPDAAAAGVSVQLRVRETRMHAADQAARHRV